MATVHKSKPSNGIESSDISHSVSGTAKSTNVVEERKKRLLEKRDIVTSTIRFKIADADGPKVVTIDSESVENRDEETVTGPKGTFKLKKGAVFHLWNAAGVPQEWRLVPKHAKKLIDALIEASGRYVTVSVTRHGDDMSTFYNFNVIGASDVEPETKFAAATDKDDNANN